ncbi:MAG: diaminopimelate decarboxylase, partial [Bacteroidota bacterium]
MIELSSEGNYHIGGVPVDELTRVYDTPLYVYDTAVIASKYQLLNQSFPGIDLKIKYACKALTNINILRFMRSLGAGLDTVSIQEVWLGKKAGFHGNEIMYTPNCVSMEEIDMAVVEGVQINIDNISILEQFG